MDGDCSSYKNAFLKQKSSVDVAAVSSGHRLWQTDGRTVLSSVPLQRLLLFKPHLGCSLDSKRQHSWNSGSGDARAHTNTERGSVCRGRWGRPSHKSQEVAGRNVQQCHTWPRPESLYAWGRFEFQTASAQRWWRTAREEKTDLTRGDQLLSHLSIPLVHNTPQRTTPKAQPRVPYSYKHDSCLVCFGCS